MDGEIRGTLCRVVEARLSPPQSGGQLPSAGPPLAARRLVQRTRHPEMRRSMGLSIMTAFAIAACGGSTLRMSKAQDSGTNSPDLESRTDLPPNDDLDRKDLSADSGVVGVDTGPDARPLEDSASRDTTIIKNDAGRDGSIVQRDAALDRVAQDAASDSLDDGSILGADGGGVDTGLAASLIVSGSTYVDVDAP